MVGDGAQEFGGSCYSYRMGDNPYAELVGVMRRAFDEIEALVGSDQSARRRLQSEIAERHGAPETATVDSWAASSLFTCLVYLDGKQATGS
jgi:hypothetical protein